MLRILRFRINSSENNDVFIAKFYCVSNGGRFPNRFQLIPDANECFIHRMHVFRYNLVIG